MHFVLLFSSNALHKIGKKKDDLIRKSNQIEFAQAECQVNNCNLVVTTAHRTLDTSLQYNLKLLIRVAAFSRTLNMS